MTELEKGEISLDLELARAAKDLTAKATKTDKSVDAMQYTQAAMNAVHALLVLKEGNQKQLQIDVTRQQLADAKTLSSHNNFKKAD